ncbi:hypothetical protein AALO_G00229400 [Alosa alosa]|uniref:Uncharacterized protein n=1 Tax=Alosa alosa TaxID=278164 RepID=A0AAV6FX68_9TELE|nr:hypothetical protein AALO_G00229400 [Alosa alosa]
MCLGFCTLIFLRTSELQSRIVSLESQRDTQLSGWIALEQVEPVILSRLDQILEEKLAARLPKIRETRDAPRDCVCPPGIVMTTGARCISGAAGRAGIDVASLRVMMQARMTRWHGPGIPGHGGL